MFRPEILAPAGSPLKLRTAIRYGADAVYLAGQRFGLRSAADNFSVAEIAAGCRFAHARGAKVYVTLNGFLFDDELAALPPFLTELETAGVDAVIVSDLGALETVRAHSRLPIHISTQANTLNVEAARFWKSRGATRIVLAREVSVEAAAAIKRQAEVEVEMFVHGALCMAYSGNCVISNYTAGRDSNRGGCVQSCRFRYDMLGSDGEAAASGHFLSSKDLAGLRLMRRFVAGQIDSLKIEGRMKGALYAATTAGVYARARDWAVAGHDDPPVGLARELSAISHRGYTEGHLAVKAGADSVYQPEAARGQTHEPAGRVVDCRAGRVAVLLNNALTAGEPVEALLTDGRTLSLDTTDMRDLAGAAIERGRPNQVALLACLEPLENDLLLRKPLRDPALDRRPALV